MTPSRAYFSLPGDETRSGAQDLRRELRHSARSNRPWSAPKDQGLSGTLASNGGEHRRLRRSAGMETTNGRPIQGNLVRVRVPLRPDQRAP